MRHYKLYFMVQARIVEGLDLACADDDTAQRIADQRFARANPAYDAIETWQGLRLVCRRERPFAATSHGRDPLRAELRV